MKGKMRICSVDSLIRIGAFSAFLGGLFTLRYVVKHLLANELELWYVGNLFFYWAMAVGIYLKKSRICALLLFGYFSWHIVVNGLFLLPKSILFEVLFLIGVVGTFKYHSRDR